MDSVGSLETGKQADIIAVDLSQPETQPLYHPISQLVYACNGSQVSHSWIAGEAVMAERRLLRIDQTALTRRVTDSGIRKVSFIGQLLNNIGRVNLGDDL